MKCGHQECVESGRNGIGEADRTGRGVVQNLTYFTVSRHPEINMAATHSKHDTSSQKAKRGSLLKHFFCTIAECWKF